MIPERAGLSDLASIKHLARISGPDVAEVNLWCADNGVSAAFYGRVHSTPCPTGPKTPFVDYWVVPDTGHRVHFMMRWG